jgi:hypothetical protein
VRQPGGKLHALVARQLAPEGGQYGAHGLLGLGSGGVGAFVAHLLQHLLERHAPGGPARLLLGNHC